MRFLIPALILLVSPAYAWDFTAAPICTLSHSTAEAEVRVTYDPRIPIYAITLRRTDPWPAAPVFALRFDGARRSQIATARHTTDDAGRSLTVTDHGFGNVLDGLEFNDTATAKIGDVSLTIALTGAAPEVHKFRDCTLAGLA